MNTLGTLYQEKHAAVHRLTGTFAFFDQEASRYRNELMVAETQLTNFDSDVGIVAPVAQKQLLLEEIGQFRTDRNRIAPVLTQHAGVPLHWKRKRLPPPIARRRR